MRILKYCLFLLLISCVTETKKAEKSKKEKSDPAKKDGIVRTYHANGKIRAEVPVVDGKRNGHAVEYFSDGKKYLEIDYVDGKNHGVTKRYYETGALLEETTYKHGQMDGAQKKYRRNGNLSTEAVYRDGKPCLGLKEYLTDNTLKKNYPTIVIQPVDRILKEGKYILRLSLSDKGKNVTFYKGTLSGNCLDDEPIKLDTNQGVSELTFRLLEGMFIMEEVPIIAKVKTPLGNYYLTQRTYNLAIEHR